MCVLSQKCKICTLYGKPSAKCRLRKRGLWVKVTFADDDRTCNVNVK